MSNAEQSRFTRRDVLVGLALQGVASGVRSQAVAPPAARRIGILAWGSPREELDFERFFLAALSQKGWSEGKNIVISRAYAEERVERLAVLANELVRNRMDVIVTGGNLTTIAAARATRSIPIVFSASLPFAVEQGLIESFARPGHNVTGTGTDTEVIGKRLEYLKQLAPSATRLAWFQPDVLASVETEAAGRVDILPVLFRNCTKGGIRVALFCDSPR